MKLALPVLPCGISCQVYFSVFLVQLFFFGRFIDVDVLLTVA